MKTIHKYPLVPNRTTKLNVSKDFTILCFRIQNEIPCIWYITNPDAKDRVEIKFTVVGTGWALDEGLDLKYIGTDFSEGSFVWHCFQIVEG